VVNGEFFVGVRFRVDPDYLNTRVTLYKVTTRELKVDHGISAILVTVK